MRKGQGLMEAGKGMERFLNLSLGSQVGASGVALIAVLEFKRLLQHQVGYSQETGTSTIKLTAEEWRTIAGIHVRKTFERTKAKLEELGVLRIEREGKLLKITLWPSAEITTQTELGTRCQTDSGTSCETNHETKHGTSSGTETVSLLERVLSSKEDEVFLTTDEVRRNVGPLRDPLNRYSLHRQTININNEINETTNNAPRYEGISKFATYWVQEAGHSLTPYEKEGLVRFIRLGYTEELCVEALRCAVAADNRQMGYVLGILRNWYREGVRCLEDVALAKEHWDDQRFVNRADPGKV